MAGPRIAIFTHDTFGLGHVRRCLHFARALAERDASAAILLITGSPALLAFRSLPGNMDVVKIPTVARTGAREYRPPHLPLPLDEVTGMRSRLTSEAVRGFAPDVFLVDNFPLGSRGELLPVLRELKKTGLFTLPGFAKFRVVKKPATKARQGINPFTKQPMTFAAKPASKAVRARPIKSIKDAVA